MNWLFGKKKSKLELLATKKMPCSDCGHVMNLIAFHPLTTEPCPDCGEENFIPMKVGNFWLHTPLRKDCNVYKSYHTNYPEDHFAVKILPKKQRENEENTKNLLWQANVCKSMNVHPCLPAHISSGIKSRECYFAMEYIEGPSLGDFIRNNKTISPVNAMKMALRMMAAEQHLNNYGLLYRNLHPDNIIIEPKGLNVTLINFHYANEEDKAYDEGTPEELTFFASPERLAKETETLKSEIYSMGKILIYAISGNTEFDSANSASTLLESSEAFGAVIDKMLDPNPEKRFTDYTDLERTIVGLLGS